MFNKIIYGIVAATLVVQSVYLLSVLLGIQTLSNTNVFLLTVLAIFSVILLGEIVIKKDHEDKNKRI